MRKKKYDQLVQKRQKKEKITGEKARGRTPKGPTSVPNEKDQYNFTDPESRIMKTSKGFDQCYNGQAAVNEDMLIVGAHSNAHVNDKLDFILAIDAVPQELGDISNTIADTGYFSEKNIADCQEKNIKPIISIVREKLSLFFQRS